uniref:Uncharacterized protein n=1 Tax=Meloidogyne floridensis TaxID=298350 RepID=A0A915NGU5_9BILA
MSRTIEFPFRAQFNSQEEYQLALDVFNVNLELLNSIDKLSASNGSLDNKKSPVKLFGPKENSGSMTYNHQANNSGKKSKIVSPTQHPSNSSFNLNPTSGETDQNGDIEMVSANNTTEHLPVTPPKTHKKSGCSKGSRFQTAHSMEFGSSQLADSKPERNQQKPHLVDGKLVDKSTKKNPQKAGNSCDWPISKLCPPNQNTFENNQVVSINYYGNKNEHTMSTHSSEQNICEEKFVPKPIGIPCLKGL